MNHIVTSHCHSLSKPSVIRLSYLFDQLRIFSLHQWKFGLVWHNAKRLFWTPHGLNSDTRCVNVFWAFLSNLPGGIYDWILQTLSGFHCASTSHSWRGTPNNFLVPKKFFVWALIGFQKSLFQREMANADGTTSSCITFSHPHHFHSHIYHPSWWCSGYTYKGMFQAPVHIPTLDIPGVDVLLIASYSIFHCRQSFLS